MGDKMENLHIWKNEKFTDPYIQFINKYFNQNEHLFMIIGGLETKFGPNKNVIQVSRRFEDFFRLLFAMNLSNKIYLHSLFFPKILILLLFLQPWLLKKCYWVVWGGDLYDYLKPRNNFKSISFEFMRAFIIRRFCGLITHIKGDYELAKKWYHVRGKYHYSFMYPSNLYKDFPVSYKSKNEDISYIQVGNSADPSNNHIEIFEKLHSLNLKNIRIICPLSYGNKEYAESIVIRGKELFGNNFEPLLNFLPIDKYLEILSNIDIAIFNHNRQQAVGNITTLLGLGKKVYIRDDITTWLFCKEHGLKVYSINNEFHTLLSPINKKTKNKNVEKVKEHFSITKLTDDWKKIFERN